MENTEQTTVQTPKPKAEPTKFDGVSAQINLSPNSEIHRRFARLFKESGAYNAREFINTLLELYENPPQAIGKDATIADLKQQLSEAQNKVTDLQVTIEDDQAEIDDLKLQLATARNEANENAAAGQGQQAQIDELHKQLDGAIIVKPNPVSAFFLNEMAERENTTPAKILERLFIDDLQNPRANNLPYTVSSSRIREVMEELKKEAAHE